MSEIHTCAECGVVLPPDAPSGLCLKCLLRLSIDDTPTVSVPAPEQFAHGQLMFIPSDPNRKSRSAAPRIHYFGDYELLEEIARGGMGVVYKARQVSLNRIVAVKMILAGQLASEAEVKRFHTEAEAAANLQHPNIVGIHEVGEKDGQHYFSMSYVEGRSLGEVVKTSSVSPQAAAAVVGSIAAAIHYAHQRGILHRDLKPQNVIMDEEGQPHITDFGLAKRMERDVGLTQSGAVLGSPSYMSPEQASARQDLVGPASDVYSLGAILYELLTGRPPFQGETPMETLLKVRLEEPIAPRKLNGNVPVDLETLCSKCLEKQPERRFPSARLFAEELQRFVNHEPILTRPGTRTRKTWNWLQRHPWTVAAILCPFVKGDVHNGETPGSSSGR